MKRTIFESVVSSGSFRMLSEAIRESGLVETLRSGGPFTVFAPTDQAFARLLGKEAGDPLAGRSKLRGVLAYHIVPGRLSYFDVRRFKSLRTLQGQRLSVDSSHGVLRVNGSEILRADIECLNGTVHVIDSVLLPVSFAEALPY